MIFHIPDSIEIATINNELCLQKGIVLSMLRLDTIDPVISGNKLFKLRYYLDEAIKTNKQIVTFGGAYSNHLVACANACKKSGIKCTGIVRGEEPKILSHSLRSCLKDGMSLTFISRREYDQMDAQSIVQNRFPDLNNYLIIPEGGYGAQGVNGAMEIAGLYSSSYSHVCLAVGTGTTLAGILQADKGSNVIGFNVTHDDIQKRLSSLNVNAKNCRIISDFTFGGYAKKSVELFNFMNAFYRENNVPTDFVYTGKMMFGIFDLIKNNFFPSGCKILAIHTGGLQGNLSLPEGTLLF